MALESDVHASQPARPGEDMMQCKPRSWGPPHGFKERGTLLRKGTAAHRLGGHPKRSPLHRSSQSCQTRRCWPSSGTSADMKRVLCSSALREPSRPVPQSLTQSLWLLFEDNHQVTDLSSSCPHSIPALNLQTFPPDSPAFVPIKAGR